MNKSNPEKLFEYVGELGNILLTRIEKRYEPSEWKSYNIYQTGPVEDGYAPSDRIGLRVFFDRFNDLSELERKIDELGLSSIKEELLGCIPLYKIDSSTFENNLHKEDKEKFFEEHYTVYPLPRESNTNRIDIYQNTKNSLEWLTHVETPEELYILFKRLSEGLKKKEEFVTAENPKIYSIIRKRGIECAEYNHDEFFSMIYSEGEGDVFRFLGEPFPELKYIGEPFSELEYHKELGRDCKLLNNAIRAMEVLEDYLLHDREQNLYPWNRF